MVFVHSRNDTLKTARVMCELAKNKGEITVFHCPHSSAYGEARKNVCNSSLNLTEIIVEFQTNLNVYIILLVHDKKLYNTLFYIFTYILY